MNKRILLGGILAGVTYFVWGALSHMALGLGEVGIRSIPNETVVMAPMRENIRQAGFYFFPGMEQAAGASDEQKKASTRQWEEKIRQGPWGVLIYHPTGAEPISLTQLGGELASNIAMAVIAAFLLARVFAGVSGLLARAGMTALLGAISSLDVHFSYWNWYGFPASFSLAAATDALVGWFLAGLVLAWRIKPGS